MCEAKTNERDGSPINGFKHMHSPSWRITHVYGEVSLFDTKIKLENRNSLGQSRQKRDNRESLFLSVKYGDLSVIYGDLSVKYGDLSVKYQDLSVKY